MTNEGSGQERRRGELMRSLPELSKTRDAAYRRNSDARALGRAGVKHAPPEEMVRLADAEAAADGAMRDAQRELRDIDSKIELAPRPGLAARLGRAGRRARRAR
jgi:hypothetical protein